MTSTPTVDDDDARSQSPEDSTVLLEQDASQEERSSDGAPRYPVPSRRLAAVEIPAVVKDIDRAVKAFGRVSSLSHVSSLPGLHL